MASEVDICNLALARLGDTATVASLSPPEGSAQAEHCAVFYPVSRDALLEMHPWKFAMRRVVLPALTMSDPLGWQFAYAAPNDVIRLVGVFAHGGSQPQPYEVMRDSATLTTILTNQADAVLQYVAKVVDTTVFSPLFVDALAWLLASNLAGPLIKGDAGAQMAQTCYRHFLIMMSQARVSDANQHMAQQEHTPAWVAAR